MYSLLIMHNYMLSYPIIPIFIHFSGEGLLPVPFYLQEHKIECQSECQSMKDGSSSCRCLQVHTGASVSPTEESLILKVPGEHN